PARRWIRRQADRAETLAKDPVVHHVEGMMPGRRGPERERNQRQKDPRRAQEDSGRRPDQTETGREAQPGLDLNHHRLRQLPISVSLESAQYVLAVACHVEPPSFPAAGSPIGGVHPSMRTPLGPTATKNG